MLSNIEPAEPMLKPTSSSIYTQASPSNCHTVSLVFLIVIRVISKHLFQFSAQPSLWRRLVKRGSIHFPCGQDATRNLSLHAVTPSAVLILDAHVEADHGFAVIIAEAVGCVIEGVFFGDRGGDRGPTIYPGPRAVEVLAVVEGPR